MGIVIRQSVITSAIAYVGVAIGYLNMLWFFPVVLSSEELGLFRFIQDTALLFVPFAQAGLSQGILRYFPEFGRQRGFFGFMLLLSMLSFLLFLGVFLLFQDPFTAWFAEKSPEVNQYHFLLLACTFLLTWVGILEAFSRSLLQIVIPALVRELLFRLGAALLVLAYFLEVVSLSGLLFGLLAIYSIGFAVLLVALIRHKEISLALNLRFIRKDFLYSFLKYVSLTMVGSSGILIIARIDTLMVTAMLGLQENAIYAIAFFIATVIEIPKRAITQITTPLISQSFLKNDLKEVGVLYSKVSIHQLVIGLLLFIGILANLENLYYYVPNGEIYQLGKWVVIWVGVGKLVDMLAGINGEIIVMSKYYVFNIVSVALLALFAIAGNWILIPIYGFEGSAMAFAASLIVFNGVKFGFLWWKFGLQPFSQPTVRVILAGGLVFLISSLLPRIQPVWLDMLLRSAGISVVYITLIYWIKPSEEINLIAQKAQHLLKRIWPLG